MMADTCGMDLDGALRKGIRSCEGDFWGRTEIKGQKNKDREASCLRVGRFSYIAKKLQVEMLTEYLQEIIIKLPNR